jgi:photosystem II stability/assembly factor-like uncharacterized protein
MRTRHLLALLVVLASAAAGCGGGDSAGSSPQQQLAVPWVDPDGDPPYIGSLSANPADGALFLASNTGLFRFPPGRDRPQKVTGVLSTPNGSGKISEALVVRFTGPNALIASGHPSSGSSLPPALGLIRSADGGRTWEPVSELGSADFHVLARADGLLVAPLFGQSQILVSADEGRTFKTRAAPSALVDLAVDPSNRDRWVASSDQGLFATVDGGRTWRQRDPTPNVRFAWAQPDRLYRIDPGGPVKASADGGETWEDLGNAGGEPQALALDADGVLYMASLDGAVKRSDDEGATWRRVAGPK